MPNNPDLEYYTRQAGKFYALEFMVSHLLRLHLEKLPEMEGHNLSQDILLRFAALEKHLPVPAFDEAFQSVREIVKKANLDFPQDAGTDED